MPFKSCKRKYQLLSLLGLTYQIGTLFGSHGILSAWHVDPRVIIPKEDTRPEVVGDSLTEIPAPGQA